jgi:exopolysaccharide production protein ExoQ
VPPLLALSIGFAIALGMFWRDRERRQGLSLALCVPLIWYLTCASRPLGVWFSIWGVPLGGGSGEEGGFVDRYFYATLLVIGWFILNARGFNWGTTLSRSPWLFGLLAFMALTILWSNYPYVSFKRYIKMVGSVIMALVILTERKPGAAFLAVLRYALYLHIPLSIICNKYFRHLSVNHSWDGASELWQGIATSKNTLGQVAMLGFIYFLWEVGREWRSKGWRNPHLAYLGMSGWLLKGSDNGLSLTAVIVAFFAAVIFLRLQQLHAKALEPAPFCRLALAATLTLAALIYSHGIVLFEDDSLLGKMITTFGRNITLTDRTHIWSGMYEVARGSFFGGIGFGGFWIDREANIAWNARMTWVLGQGHSGYVDTFLQTGTIGLILLIGLLLSTFNKLLRSQTEDFNFFAFRLTLLLTIIFINITETTFLRGDHHLWLLFMVVCWSVALPQPASSDDGDRPERDWGDSASISTAEEATDLPAPLGDRSANP